MTTLDLCAITARVKQHTAAIGPGGQKAWLAGQLAADVPALLAEVRALRARLAAAEQVCVLFGWSPARYDTETDKAVSQAWHDWCRAYGSPDPSPEWNQRIKQLALRRDQIRGRTLAAIRGEVATDA